MDFRNPFEHYYPENLTPKDVFDLFVKEYTEHNALTANKHTIVEGSRGSGKSMLFKFLEPACQAILYNGWKNFLHGEKPFIAIYINCNTGDWKRSEFQSLLDSEEPKNKLFLKKVIIHDFIIKITEWTLKTFNEQLNEFFVENVKLINEIIQSLDKKYLYIDENLFPRTLSGLKKVLLNEKKLINESFLECVQKLGTENCILNYFGNLSEISIDEDAFLRVFFNNLRKLINASEVPFFLLFDEAGESILLNLQQQAINSLISLRSHFLFSVKVSVRPESYIDIDLSGKCIEYIHDYDKTNLDSLYTNNSQAYYKRIVEIGNKRLKLAGFKTNDIRDFLPESQAEINKMKKAIELTKKEYRSLKGNNKTESESEYVYKYARARFFQLLLKKSSYGYTGFNNLVNFSAGTTRAFLDPCSDMIDRFIAKYPEVNIEDIKFIPSEIQKDVIKDFSNDFIERELISKISRRDKASNDRKILEAIYNLIESLGEAFKIRLNNKKSRYPRIISFSIRENVLSNEFLEIVLKKSLQEYFFQKRWYRGKSGYETFQCYILNRRLCPRYNLDLSGFQGRIELSQTDLSLAMGDTKTFIRLFKSKESKSETETGTQLELINI
jgi:hypothetical protein